MKFIRKLNFQLFLVASLTIFVLNMALGIILPYNIRNYFDDHTFDLLLSQQQLFMLEPDTISDLHTDILHLIFDKEGTVLRDDNLISDEMFDEVIAHMQKQKASIDRYVYHFQQDHIYYVINKSNPDYNFVTIKIDNVNSVISNSVFYNVVNGLAFVLVILLIGILYWSYRLISNLKEIKRVVKSIGDEDLDIEIKSNTYTVEVNDLMHELDEMRKRLKHNEQLKNEMVHNISHDLKTPISIIKMCSESIIDEIYPYGTVEATAKVINEQAERLEKKVTNLLYLNHLTHLIEHEADGSQTAFELRPLILSVVKYMEENHPSLNFELDLDESHVLGDEEKWRVVFENLIANSQRFAATKIQITLIHNTIEIYNDGPPIVESEFGSIFKPFEVGVGGVTGLGLSIVHKTLTLYHYSISYENLSTGIKFILEPKQT